MLFSLRTSIKLFSQSISTVYKPSSLLNKIHSASLVIPTAIFHSVKKPSAIIHSVKRPKFLSAMVNRVDLLNFVFESGRSPSSSDFRVVCESWLDEKFPGASQIDNKSKDVWLSYFCKKATESWRKKNFIKKDFLKMTFFAIDINATELIMDIDPQPDTEPEPALPLIDLKNGDLTNFQFYVCPTCDFKSQERLPFMTHVVQDHPYVQGKICEAAQDHIAA